MTPWAAFLASVTAILVLQMFDASVMSWHVGFGPIGLFALGAARRTA